ncbi:MAG: thioredoxin family protein [Rhodocyclaceae bacterium]|nr:thioredoxin family protein [Rhodocyclaceae bacterium]
MLIKILGTGCAKCQRLEQLTREVAAEAGLAVSIEHVREMDKIMAYPVMSTPALVVDDVVKSSGRMPSREEIADWLGAD